MSDFPELDLSPPICKRCGHCVSIHKASKNRYDVDCAHNPNLGAIGHSYAKCASFVSK